MSGSLRDLRSKATTILRSYSRWEAGVIGCGLVFGTLLLAFQLSYDAVQAGRVLSTLATTQASVLAIVFSVSILGVQLVATRYSARMMTLITSSAAFQGTLLLLFFSIAYDLILLLQLPVLTTQQILAGLAVAGGLAVGSGLALTRYVTTTLELSSPEGLLSAYVDQITLESYRTAVIESRETEGAFHPMHELHSVVMSGLSNNEWGTAENGLMEFEELANRMVSELAVEGYLRQTDSLATHYFKTPIEEYLPRIATQATADGESDIAQKTVSTLEEIVLTGLKEYYPQILGSAGNGLSTIVREAPEGRAGDSIRGQCLATFGTLVTTAAERPSPSDFTTLLSLYAGQFRLLLNRDREAFVYRHTLGEYFRQSIATAHATTLEQYGDFIAATDIDWHSPGVPDEHSNLAPVELVFAYRRYALEVVTQVLHYVHRNDRWPIAVNTLRDAWAELVEDAIENDTGDYAIAICRWYIDLAYVINQGYESDIDGWAKDLAFLIYEQEADETVTAAFNEALDEGITPVFKSERRRASHRSESRSFFERVFDRRTGDRARYEDWVAQFQTNIDGRVRRLRTD